MVEEPKKPRDRPRKPPWPEPIPEDPENLMRIIMRTPAEKVRNAMRNAHQRTCRKE